MNKNNISKTNKIFIRGYNCTPRDNSLVTIDNYSLLNPNHKLVSHKRPIVSCAKRTKNLSKKNYKNLHIEKILLDKERIISYPPTVMNINNPKEDKNISINVTMVPRRPKIEYLESNMEKTKNQ